MKYANIHLNIRFRDLGCFCSSASYIYDLQNVTMMLVGKALQKVKEQLRSSIWKHPEDWVEEYGRKPIRLFPVYLSLRDDNGLHNWRQSILENV